MNAILQVVDFYKESIVLTRDNDVKHKAVQETIMYLTRIGILYHKVLQQKSKAKKVLNTVLQLAQSFRPFFIGFFTK